MANAGAVDSSVHWPDCLVFGSMLEFNAVKLSQGAIYGEENGGIGIFGQSGACQGI